MNLVCLPEGHKNGSGGKIWFPHTWLISCNSSRYKTSSNAGAKNHAIVMPDASTDATLDALVGAGFSAAGQRCTAISTVIFIGGSKSWEDKLVNRAKALKVSAGIEPDVDIGPVISKQAKEKIYRLIQLGVDSGARLVLDGRQITVPNYEQGNFIGPTILCDVTNNMGCFKEEFCDVRSMDRVSLDMQSRVFRSNDADALTPQQKYQESSNRVSTPLQLEEFQSRSGVSLTLHSNDVPSTDEERQQCQGPGHVI